MEIFGIYVPLPILAVATVAIVAAYVFWTSLRARPATQAASSTHPAGAPPTLYKGVNLLIGAGIAALVAWAIETVIYGLLFSIGPNTLAASVSARTMAHAFGWLGGGIVAVLFFVQGLLPPISIGFKGMPTIIGARSPVWFLHPEGWAWTIPYITGVEPENMQGRPLVDQADPEAEEILVEALAMVMPAPESAPQTKTLSDMEKFFFASVKVRIAVRIQTFNPFVYRSFEDAESYLFSAIQQEVRLWIKDKQIFELPGLKAALQNHLENKLDLIGKEMGIDFVRLAVTDITLPPEIEKASAQIPVELIERSAQKYEAETIEQIIQYLRKTLPDLPQRELKNMVLAMIGKGTSQAYSFEGNMPIPVVPVTNTPKGAT